MSFKHETNSIVIFDRFRLDVNPECVPDPSSEQDSDSDSDSDSDTDPDPDPVAPGPGFVLVVSDSEVSLLLYDTWVHSLSHSCSYLTDYDILSV